MYKWEIMDEYDGKGDVIKKILENRGYITDDEKDTFLNPPPVSYWFKKLPKELLLSLRSARTLINEFIEKEKVIIIHGDYDVDGICATAILYSTLQHKLGYKNVYAFIPNRFEHGYGLSKSSIEAALERLDKKEVEKGVLVITVDSGITSSAEVELLKRDDHQVIITDHHQKPPEVPKADVIVWYDQVVGATISWLLASVLGADDPHFMSYCCLATVTDLQPVLGFNRTIVKKGLEILNTAPPPGIRSLLELSGKKGVEVTTYDLGWLIGPRLNASGRVEDAVDSLNLLLENDPAKVKELAWKLNQINSARQDKTFEMYELATKVDEKEIPHVIVSHNENYHEGIIGLVASRLAKKYYRPAVVISTTNDVYKGSVRSIPGVNIIELLREIEDLFLSLGGHPMAAGFSIHADKFEEMLENLERLSKKMISEDLFIRVLEVDLQVPSSVINEGLIDDLDKLRPYGLGNNQPVFATREMGVSSVNRVGKDGRHLSLKFVSGEKFYKAILFNENDLNLNIEVGDVVDVAYNLKKNIYNSQTYIDLILKDIKKPTLE